MGLEYTKQTFNLGFARGVPILQGGCIARVLPVSEGKAVFSDSGAGATMIAAVTIRPGPYPQ
jgi:hypothetical protein